MTPTLTPGQFATQWFTRVWQQRSREAIAELMAEDAKGHLEGGVTVIGPQGFLPFFDQIQAAFPDLELEILRVVADENQVFTHWRASATHGGQFAMLAATQRRVQFSGMSRMIVQNGKMTEGWDCWDQGGLLVTLQSA